jgi:hypothetical protein
MDALATENADLRREIERRHRIPKTSGKTRTHAAKLSKETKAVLRELRKDRSMLVDQLDDLILVVDRIGTILAMRSRDAHEAPSGPVEPGENDQG